MEHFHDPREIIRGIQQILISDSKRIGFLAGAGTSMAAKQKGEDGKTLRDKSQREIPLIPGISIMTMNIIENVTDEKFKTALSAIEEELTQKKQPFLLENILSLIIQKIQVVGEDILCGLNKLELIKVKELFENHIREMVQAHKDKYLFPEELLHTKFASWIKYATRKFPIEVFTTNYDYLFELGFETLNLPYFDGFVGSYEPFFDSVSIENERLLPSWTRLWKLHGSLGWKHDEKNKKIIRSTDKEEDSIMVYPSLLKYDDSRKQPYISFMDRLSSFLKKEDGVLFVNGYSFGDDHINRTILDSLTNTRSSHVIAMVYDDTLNEMSPVIKLAKQSTKLSLCTNRSAVIGGIYGKWKLKRGEPALEEFKQLDQYFEPDFKIAKETGEGDEEWTGEGTLSLVDFKRFVEFLLSFSYLNIFSENAK